MAINRRFPPASQALTELETETPTRAAVPALNSVLAQIGSIPLQALFLGVASDGLPVLLNLHDPHPGPMLITGDAGAGKTAFLSAMAQALTQTHSASDVQFGVITNYPDEWQNLPASAHQAGIFPAGHHSAEEFIDSLAVWAHSKKSPQRCIMLLVDDLESVATFDTECMQNFRWLLLRGPTRRVWPIVTLNAPRYGQILSWLPSFRTRIFGRVANPRVAEALGGENAYLDQLEAGIYFTLREKENWLRFWLPSC